MSAANKETSGNHPEAASSVSGRRLFEGTLSPPRAQPAASSYTLAPTSKAEVSIRTSTSAGNPATGRRPTAISSTAVPQPFVDPAVLQQRPPRC
ncbi:hypothetical protein F4777DRAFT_35541 [Nemania sp. FL0916]|nr:hypothetical protein F4777DRAFT_35541 [Nemania sp. FL0916]